MGFHLTSHLYLRISLRIQRIQHKRHRRQTAGLYHREHAGARAGNQHYALLVQGDWLLLVSALDIPEYYGGQFVTVCGERFLAYTKLVVSAFSTMYSLSLPDSLP